MFVKETAMSCLSEIAAKEFQPYRRNGAIDAVMALDEIDQRHHEVAELLIAARVVMLHGEECDREKLASHLYAALALLATIAAPFDAVEAELQRLRQIAATAGQHAGAGNLRPLTGDKAS